MLGLMARVKAGSSSSIPAVPLNMGTAVERDPHRRGGEDDPNTPRFIVSQVTGVEIRPGRATEAGGRVGVGRSIPTSFYVLDRAFCHHTVARFDAGVRSKDSGGRWQTDDQRRTLAEKKAAELNAWDEAA